MKKHFKIAVHFHCFYIDLIDEILKKYLSNLTEKYDLFVTMVSKDKEAEIKIKKFKKNAKIKIVENRGYDIGPFIDFLYDIDLKKYDLILKIHTKKSEQFKVNGTRWRNIIFQGILRSVSETKNILSRFKRNKKVGMIGYVSQNTKIDDKDQMNDCETYFDICEKFGYTKSHSHFIPGTMFWARANCFQAIKDKKIKINDFGIVNKAIHSGSLAHGYERFLGRLVENDGFNVVSSECTSVDVEKQSKLSRFFFQKKRDKYGILVTKIFKIPILSKFMQEKKASLYPNTCFLVKKNRKRKYILKKLINLSKPYLKKVEISLAPSVKLKKRPKIIWQCWMQGKSKAPKLVKECWASVKKHMPDYEQLIITDENYVKYVDIPNYIIGKYKKGNISVTHFSDILRVYLLNKHGGIWMDSTVFMTGKLPKKIEKNDFFVFQSKNVLPIFISSWFILTKPNHPLIKIYKDLTEVYFKGFVPLGCCFLSEALILQSYKLSKTSQNNTVMEQSYFKYNEVFLDYFMPHILFYTAITKNNFYKKLFSKICFYRQEAPHFLHVMLKKENQSDKNLTEIACLSKTESIHKLTLKEPLVSPTLTLKKSNKIKPTKKEIKLFKIFIEMHLNKHKKAMLRFLYQRKETKSGKLRIKILKIPVWSKKIKGKR